MENDFAGGAALIMVSALTSHLVANGIASAEQLTALAQYIRSRTSEEASGRVKRQSSLAADMLEQAVTIGALRPSV